MVFKIELQSRTQSLQTTTCFSTTLRCVLFLRFLIRSSPGRHLIPVMVQNDKYSPSELVSWWKQVGHLLLTTTVSKITPLVSPRLRVTCLTLLLARTMERIQQDLFVPFLRPLRTASNLSFIAPLAISMTRQTFVTPMKRGLQLLRQRIIPPHLPLRRLRLRNRRLLHLPVQQCLPPLHPGPLPPYPRQQSLRWPRRAQARNYNGSYRRLQLLALRFGCFKTSHFEKCCIDVGA